MIIDTPDGSTVEGAAAEHYAADLAEDGFVFSHTRAMAVNPEALVAFEGLVRALIPSIGVRTYELVTLAAAGAVKSPHCLLAHGRRALGVGALDEAQLEHVANGEGAAGLSDADVAVMAYAVRLSRDASTMTDADSAALREVGFSDRQIVDITLAAAARNYYSRALQALAVPVEEVPGLSPEVAAGLLSPLRR